MKNKLLALALVLTIVAGAFTGLCLTVGATETGESPNLLEMYGYNPHFDDGVKPWQVSSTAGVLEQYDADSADGDGFCALVSARSQNYAVPRLLGAEGLNLFLEQGAGKYYYSFYVKCAKKDTTATIRPVFQLCYGGSYSQQAVDKEAVITKWPSGTVEEAGIEINSEKWTKIETEIDVALEIDGKKLAEAIVYSVERSFVKDEHAPNLLFDDFVLIKKDGGWVKVTPEPEVSVPSQTRFNQVVGPDKTQIGAVSYHVWNETYEEWWNTDNKYAISMDRASVQEMRSLAPAEYHFHLPFFAKINTSVKTATNIVGDLSAGVPELPEYTEAIWKQEMEYAIDAGIDFMAYLWSEKGRINAQAYTHHINNKGLDGKIKMCAILQRSTQDLNTLANAATEDYWYKIDGMPVVYIYGGKDAITEDFVALIRKKIAIAQYAKTGEAGKPAYIIGMGLYNYSTAVGVASRGIDAVSWYGIDASRPVTDEMKADWDAKKTMIRTISYKMLADYTLQLIKDVSEVATEGYAAVSALATLGRDTVPRMVNPVSWVTGSGNVNIPYGGYTAELPTANEVTSHVLDVLNLNKENRALYRTNTVLIYAWNEFNEGGWFCPTIKVDEKGNAIKNADGSNQVNREYLDAVKKAIELYREKEAEAAIFDAEGNKIKDIELATPQVAETTAPTSTNAPSTTDTPDADAPQQEEGDGNGWVLWAIIGGAVVAVAAITAVIILKKKAVKKATEE